jgi:alpha-glucosidase
MHTLANVRSFYLNGQSLVLDCGGPKIALTVLTPHMVRVRLAPDGTFAARRSWAVTCPDDDFSAVPCEIQEHDETIMLHTNQFVSCDDSSVSVLIERDPCRISFVDSQGQVFCCDEAGMQWRMPDQQDVDVTDPWSVACVKRIEPEECFFGFGERTGPLNRRGRQMINWTTDAGAKQGVGTDPLYIAVPVFMVVRPGLAYGVFFNNTWYSRFDIGSDRPDVWRMQAEGGELDYYIIYGPTPSDVSEGIGKLLGTTPLPPRWALGYHQSRWSYAPDRRVREVATEFRRRGIPCDAIHLDIAYMDEYRVFTWDSQRFPDPKGLIADLRCDGFRVVTIIDPGVKADPDYAVYQQGSERDMFICRGDGEVFHGYVWPDDAVFSDYTRAEVRQWWGDLQQHLVEQGVSGIWNDMNEPPVFHQPFSAAVRTRTWGTIDADACQGGDGETTTHAEVHNLFGQGMAQASYEGLRRHLGGERPFVLTRSGFAGIQRWSACWMGDNASWWEHLEMAMPQLMNMGISGVPFVGVDIGGFGGNASGELFARWMQFGVLSPFCRGHTTHFSRDHEPWAFGPDVEAICKTYLTLRYRLLPYLYTLFWEAAQRGTPVLRPLFYHFPDDTYTYELHDQVLLGPFIMAAPMYQPGRTHRAVYFPEGVWYDWWSDEVITGPSYRLVHAPLEKLPLYVRAGAILPQGPEICHTDERVLDPLTLDLYPGEGTFTLYEDDGQSFEYERGDFCMTMYRLYYAEGEPSQPRTLVFDMSERVGGYSPPDRQVVLKVHNVAAPRAEDDADVQYDAVRRLLTLELEDDGNPHTFMFG